MAGTVSTKELGSELMPGVASYVLEMPKLAIPPHSVAPFSRSVFLVFLSFLFLSFCFSWGRGLRVVVGFKVSECRPGYISARR